MNESKPEHLNALEQRRREELDELRRRGVDPYPHAFARTSFAAAVKSSFVDGAHATAVAASVAGRITALRRMGKAAFCDVEDASGRIQLHLQKDKLAAAWDTLSLLDLGDIVGVEGVVFRTDAGEVSIDVHRLVVLAKSLRPLPIAKANADAHALSNQELRYRQRYVDLAVDPAVRGVFVKRAKIVTSIRGWLDEQGFLEVETPVLQPLYGGAFAEPFVTHYRALDEDVYLRISDELFLKRLIVGGFDGVYEIGKDFRNESIDRKHNPEFTMLELYVAYHDYVWMMDVVEKLVCNAAVAANASASVMVRGQEIHLDRPWRRVTMSDAIREFTGRSIVDAGEAELRRIADELQVRTSRDDGAGKIIDAIFSEKVEPHLVEPTFVTDYPAALSPLAKRHRSNDALVERFEGFCDGREICNAYTELNDPLEQRTRFEEQMRARERGDRETQPLDEDFLRALEYGMPPTAGLGIGIDRLTMFLTGQSSIRDVILFPQMKREA